MKNKLILCFIIIILPYCALAKSQNRTFINEFTVDTATANMNRIADRILKEEFLNAGYRITDRESIRAGLSVQELQMVLGSNDENQLKTIMASGDVDYIVYGYISSRDNHIFITTKMLDKSGGEAKLGRVKTVSIRNELSKEFFEEACTLLSRYLVTGNTKNVLKFQDKMLAEERRYEISHRQQLLTEEEVSAHERYRKKVDNYKRERKHNITKHKSVLRIAYNPYTITTNNDIFNASFKEGHQFSVELNIPVYTETMGLDFVARYTARYFSRSNNQLPPDFDEKFLKDWEKGRTLLNAFNFGIRPRLRFYFLMTEFDIYGIGAVGYNTGSFNAFGGGGIEMAFFPRIGFFAEYNRGWSSIGEQNINVENNHQLLIGTTFRL